MSPITIIPRDKTRLTVSFSLQPLEWPKDLFSLLVLYSQYRPRDILKRVFLVSFHNLYVHEHLQKMKRQRKRSLRNYSVVCIGKTKCSVTSRTSVTLRLIFSRLFTIASFSPLTSTMQSSFPVIEVTQLYLISWKALLLKRRKNFICMEFSLYSI